MYVYIYPTFPLLQRFVVNKKQAPPKKNNVHPQIDSMHIRYNSNPYIR